MSNQDFYNITVTALMTAKSPILIGDGETGNSFTIASCKNDKEHYYIPGATIKGSLRNLSTQLDISEDDANAIGLLFGIKRQNDNSNSEGHTAGQVRFLDAIAKQKSSESNIVRNSINPITRTAKDGHLFTQSRVDTGTQFKLTLQLDKANLTELQSIKGLLNIWGTLIN